MRICICYPLISQPTRGSEHVQARHRKSLEESSCECFANGSVSLLWDLLALTFDPAGFCAHFQQSVRRQAMSSGNCESGGPGVRRYDRGHSSCVSLSLPLLCLPVLAGSWACEAAHCVNSAASMNSRSLPTYIHGRGKAEGGWYAP